MPTLTIKQPNEKAILMRKVSHVRHPLTALFMPCVSINRLSTAVFIVWKGRNIDLNVSKIIRRELLTKRAILNRCVRAGSTDMAGECADISRVFFFFFKWSSMLMRYIWDRAGGRRCRFTTWRPALMCTAGVCLCVDLRCVVDKHCLRTTACAWSLGNIPTLYPGPESQWHRGFTFFLDSV